MYLFQIIYHVFVYSPTLFVLKCVFIYGVSYVGGHTEYSWRE
jgi:hypothetical protein